MKIVANSSPLISLINTGEVDILFKLYKKIFIPEAVFKEVFIAGNINHSKYQWIEVRKLSEPLAAEVLRDFLGSGESEALCLAKEMRADFIIIDELAGREKAKSLGLKVTGLLGVLIAAKKKKIIPNVKPIINKLINAGFRVSDRLVKNIMSEVGESRN